MLMRVCSGQVKYATLLALLIALVATQSPAASEQPVGSPTPSVSPEVPVSISKLYTQVKTHPAGSPPTSGGQFWYSCLDFTNSSAKNITAIQFKLTYIDAFDTPITSFRADRVGQFTPGVLIQGPTSIGDVNNPNQLNNCWSVVVGVGSLSKVTAEVAKVRYSDGSIWVAPADQPVFAEVYMSGGGGFVDPPSTIVCFPGRLRLQWSFVEQNASKPKIIGCVQDWERQNGNLAGWPTPPPISSSATSPSPTPTSP